MKNLASIGCLARSAVYFSVGTLALLVALGSSYGVTTDESGALRHLDQKMGHFVLLILTVGFFCYAIWRFFQSIQDHDGYGRTLKGLGIRTGFFFSGLFHLVLGVYALNIVFAVTKRTAWGERMMARWVLTQPFGRYILGIVGISVVIAGFIQFLRAANGSFLRDLRLPKSRGHYLVHISRFGLVSRGTVFVIIGVFILNAAWKSRSREVGGLQKAWETLRQQQYGSVLLGTVAVGFMAFAVFAFIEGYYHRKSLV